MVVFKNTVSFPGHTSASSHWHNAKAQFGKENVYHWYDRDRHSIVFGFRTEADALLFVLRNS